MDLLDHMQTFELGLEYIEKFPAALRTELDQVLQGSEDSQAMLGTNLSVQKDSGSK